MSSVIQKEPEAQGPDLDPHLQAHLCEPQPHHHHHQQQQVKRQRVGAGPGSNGIGTLGILGGGMPNGGARGDTSVHTGGHTGGQRAGGSSGAQCNHDGCMKQARRPTRFCVRHGGGRRCIVLDCPKAAAGQTNKCVAHGGGKRCQAPGCTKASQCAAGLCKAHGGGRRCCEPGCRKSAQGRTGMCRAHAVARKQADRDRSGNHLDPSSAAGKASSLRGGVPGGGGDHGFNPLGDAPGVASAFHGVSTNGGGTHTTNPVGGGGGRSTTATDPAPPGAACLELFESKVPCKYALDLEGRIAWVSDSFTETFGFSVAEMKGEDLWAGLHHDDRSRIMSMLEAQCADVDSARGVANMLVGIDATGRKQPPRDIPQLEYRRKHKNGHYVPARNRGNCVVHDGHIILEEHALEFEMRLTAAAASAGGVAGHGGGGAPRAGRTSERRQAGMSTDDLPRNFGSGATPLNSPGSSNSGSSGSNGKYQESEKDTAAFEHDPLTLSPSSEAEAPMSTPPPAELLPPTLYCGEDAAIGNRTPIRMSPASIETGNMPAPVAQQAHASMGKDTGSISHLLHPSASQGRGHAMDGYGHQQQAWPMNYNAIPALV